jgi:4-hydroxybenzoate polyprenyltransferase
VAGRVSARVAWAWVTGLAVVAPLATWLVVPELLWIVAALLVLGVLYSQPPVRLKRWPPAATLVIALLLHAPLVAGIRLAGARLADASWLLASFTLCLATLPLKDIEDEAGDRAAGLGSWAVWVGGRRLAAASAVGVAVIGLASLMWLHGAARAGVAGACGAALVLLGWHLGTRAPLARLYTRLVRTIMLGGAALPLAVWLLR